MNRAGAGGYAQVESTGGPMEKGPEVLSVDEAGEENGNVCQG